MARSTRTRARRTQSPSPESRRDRTGGGPPDAVPSASRAVDPPALTTTGRVTALRVRRGERQAEVALDLPGAEGTVTAVVELSAGAGSGPAVGDGLRLQLDLARTAVVRP